MRKRRVLCWLAGVSVLVPLASPATGAPRQAPDGSVTISGATGGYADITLTRKTHFTIEDGVVVKGGNKYAGYCMQAWRLADRARAIPCGVRINTVDKNWLINPGGMVTDLLPGKYRVYLLADGPASVTLPMHNLGRHLRLTAAGRNPRGTLTFTDATGPLGLSTGHWRQRTNIRDNGATWVGWYFIGRAPAGRAEAFNMCIAPVDGDCLLVMNTFGDGRHGFSATSQSIGGNRMGIATAFGPDHGRDYQGLYDIIMWHAAADIDVSARGFQLDIDFSPGPPVPR